jgi:hypothetical protein
VYGVAQILSFIIVYHEFKEKARLFYCEHNFFFQKVSLLIVISQLNHRSSYKKAAAPESAAETSVFYSHLIYAASRQSPHTNHIYQLHLYRLHISLRKITLQKDTPAEFAF